MTEPVVRTSLTPLPRLGMINAVLWMDKAGESDEGGESRQQEELSQIREENYVQVVGKINEMEDGERKLTAFSVQPITGACTAMTGDPLSRGCRGERSATIMPLFVSVARLTLKPYSMPLHLVRPQPGDLSSSAHR